MSARPFSPIRFEPDPLTQKPAPQTLVLMYGGTQRWFWSAGIRALNRRYHGACKPITWRLTSDTPPA